MSTIFCLPYGYDRVRQPRSYSYGTEPQVTAAQKRSGCSALPIYTAYRCSARSREMSRAPLSVRQKRARFSSVVSMKKNYLRSRQQLRSRSLRCSDPRPVGSTVVIGVSVFSSHAPPKRDLCIARSPQSSAVERESQLIVAIGSPSSPPPKRAVPRTASQGLYKSKAAKDTAALEALVDGALADAGRPRGGVSKEETETFCKNARKLLVGVSVRVS